MSRVAEGLAEVEARIVAACRAAGRERDEVTLVAVSKRHSSSTIREAHALGHRAFGENYAQELAEKADALRALEGLDWHFIGHLQRNKARLAVGAHATVETLDSVRIVEALDKRAARDGVSLDVFVQVDVAGEAQKAGCTPQELGPVIAAARAAEALTLCGLMTIPPLGRAPEESRPHFRRLRELATEHGLTQLSMGMSADLEVAIEEGSTLVRVGTAIFGPRPS
ncbi:MAG: YggS family pyridoxal phosphate-dependent enzyme [Sandaracinaceae bacterium]